MEPMVNKGYCRPHAASKSRRPHAHAQLHMHMHVLYTNMQVMHMLYLKA